MKLHEIQSDVDGFKNISLCGCRGTTPFFVRKVPTQIERIPNKFPFDSDYKRVPVSSCLVLDHRLEMVLCEEGNGDGS